MIKGINKMIINNKNCDTEHNLKPIYSNLEDVIKTKPKDLVKDSERVTNVIISMNFVRGDDKIEIECVKIDTKDDTDIIKLYLKGKIVKNEGFPFENANEVYKTISIKNSDNVTIMPKDILDELNQMVEYLISNKK